MSSVRLPLNIPSMEEESRAPTDLSGRIRAFCKERKEKRKHEWKSIKIALDKLKGIRGSILNNQMKKRGKLLIHKWHEMYKERELW